MKANCEIRKAVETNGLKLWQLADALGMQDSNLSKKLRHELTNTEKARILAIIYDLAGRAKDAETEN